MVYKSIKIMGERNSGTNFVTKSIHLNFAAHIHMNAFRITAAHLKLEKTLQLEGPAKVALSESHMDALHFAQRDINFGWKHAALQIGDVKTFSTGRNVLFICVIRHPATWLRSMHRIPFHATGPVDGDFSVFLRAPWYLRPRDELDVEPLANVVALWNLKIASYLKAQNALPNVMVLRYEDVVLNFESTLARLPLPRRARDEFLIPKENARSFIREKAGYDDYKARVEADPWRDYSEADAAFVSGALDHELLTSLGYE